MKTCTNCNKANPLDANYCKVCGNWIGNATAIEEKKSFFQRIPSWLTGLILLAGGLGFIAFNILLVVSLSAFEGVASLILLAVGILLFVALPLRYRNIKAPGISPTGIFLIFFAVIGATIDQTGNPIYNTPVEWCYCPPHTSLDRAMEVTQPHPGKTIYTQDFTCYDSNGTVQSRIHILWVLVIRFVEYLILGILLICFRYIIFALLAYRSASTR